MDEIVASISRLRVSRSAPRRGRAFFSAWISAAVVERMTASIREQKNDIPIVTMMTKGSISRT